MGMGENSPVLSPTFAPNLVTFTAIEAAAAAPASSVEDATVATALRRDQINRSSCIAASAAKAFAELQRFSMRQQWRVEKGRQPQRKL